LRKPLGHTSTDCIRSGLLELCLDFNQNPALPPDLRFDISLPEQHTAVAQIKSVVPDGITPEEGNTIQMDYHAAVVTGQVPHIDLHVIREQIDQKLSKQGVTPLATLEASVSHTTFDGDANDLPEELKAEEPPGYFTSEQEAAYLLRMDAKLGDPDSAAKIREQQQKDPSTAADDKHWADLTPRELERQVEMSNPQSQHNWLKTHANRAGPIAIDIDDNESTASHEAKPARGGNKRNLAKQVGDRAVERAREGVSPGAASGFGEEDELAFGEEPVAAAGGSAKKRGKAVDVDGTYRVKGGRGGAAAKGKRKRTSGEDVAPGSAGKKAKVEAD
jgi:hypothetical protein